MAMSSVDLSLIKYIQILAKSDVSKEDLTDSIAWFQNMLVKFDLIYADPPKKYTNIAKEVGKKLFETFIKMLGKYTITEETEYFLSNELEKQSDVEEENVEMASTPTAHKDEEYVPPTKVTRHDRVPFDVKLKIVMTANEHPKWSFKTLQKRFKQHLRHNSDITRFKKDIVTGGTFLDKIEIIKRNVYDKFIEAQECKQLVTRRQLQQWAMSAAAQFRDESTKNEDRCPFRFTASAGWLSNFLINYRISNRRVIQYLSQKEIKSPPEVLNSSIQFQNLIQSISSDYNSDFIITTDQIGCEYRVNVSRTYKGERSVEFSIGALNKISHSYTAQYSLMKSGKILEKVFVCLQEHGDTFGVRVQTEVDALLQLCKNVVIVCSKSGKLTSSLYEQYLKTVVKPYVNNNPFLFIVDSGGGQKNIHMYNEIFQNDNKLTCNLQIISPKYTPICHPCDVYFYGQVKIIIKRIQNYLDVPVSGEKAKLNSRYDVIRIQSLTHYLLCAPLFKNMIQFAWYASKLASECEIFSNVNQLCFPSNIHIIKCVFDNSNSFVKCSWCTSYLCFNCFYIDFHPQHCTAMSEFYNK